MNKYFKFWSFVIQASVFLSIVLFLVMILRGEGEAKEMKCHPRTEVGESIDGISKIYETSKKGNSPVFSMMDFNKLTITNADNGSKSKMKKLSDNVFSGATTPFKWFFITNDDKTIVTEIGVASQVTYLKIFMCE